MKANKANLLQFLFRSGHLEIPEYQRSYGWTFKECKQLFEDIKCACENETQNHFLGSIIYVEKDTSQISSINTCYLVDGCQRLLSVSLFLAALVKTTEEDQRLTEIIQEKYLLNSEEFAKTKFKLGLNSNDMDTYISIIENKEELPKIHSSHIINNYLYFINLIKESRIKPENFIDGLSRFEIIDVALQRGIDDAYSVYGSSNSTTLTQSDKIRCFMHKELDLSIYTAYWNSMEEIFKDTENPHLFERYLADYITIHSSDEIPDTDNIYPAFRRVFLEKLKYQSSKEVVKHVYQYSKYFIKLTFGEEKDLHIKQHIDKINSMDAEVAYPFLLEVYDDYENGLVNKATFIDILKMVEGYLLRRKIKHPTNSSTTFSTLSKEISKILNSKGASKENLIPIIREDNDYERTIKNTLFSIEKMTEIRDLKAQNHHSSPIDRIKKPKTIKEIQENTENDEIKEYTRNPFAIFSRQ